MTPPIDPGLDLAALRALRAPKHNLRNLMHRIENHLDEAAGYLAFSGGKDSTVALHIALQVDPEIPVAVFDSGLEYPETYRYIADLADRWRLNLHVIPARLTTLEVLKATGAWDQHGQRTAGVPDLHTILIREPSATAHATHGPGEIWGVRAEESRGRAAAYANALRQEVAAHCDGCCTTAPQRRTQHGGLIRRKDGTQALGPVWNWRSDEIWGYLARHAIPINPVYNKLRSLGAPEHFLRISHMIDGTRLEEGRITWLRRGWPALFEELAEHLPRIREFV